MLKQQSLIGLTPPTRESLLTSTEKPRQISYLVKQCFDVLNNYGKTPEQIESLMRVMIEDLNPFSLAVIKKSFTHWRRENERLPTVSEILHIAQQEAKWESEGRDFLKPAPIPRAENPNKVPWCGLSWQELQSRGFMPDIERHLISLTASRGKIAAERYLNFLKNGPINHKPA